MVKGSNPATGTGKVEMVNNTFKPCWQNAKHLDEVDEEEGTSP
jgi:hypothetical protein